MTDQLETYTEAVEGVQAGAAEVPELLGAAVAHVAEVAATMAGLLADLDDRRNNLNEWARGLGLPVVPDRLRAADRTVARLVAAVRRGPGEAAVALGKAARGPAEHIEPEPASPPPLTDAVIDDAGSAALGLLAAIHHKVYDLDTTELLAGADPAAVATVLAGVALHLASTAVPDVDAWLAAMGADNALAGE